MKALHSVFQELNARWEADVLPATSAQQLDGSAQAELASWREQVQQWKRQVADWSLSWQSYVRDAFPRSDQRPADLMQL